MKNYIFILFILLFCLKAKAQRDSLTNLLPIVTIILTPPCQLVNIKKWPKHFKGNGIPSLNLKIEYATKEIVLNQQYNLNSGFIKVVIEVDFTPNYLLSDYDIERSIRSIGAIPSYIGSKDEFYIKNLQK